MPGSAEPGSHCSDRDIEGARRLFVGETEDTDDHEDFAMVDRELMEQFDDLVRCVVLARLHHPVELVSREARGTSRRRVRLIDHHVAADAKNPPLERTASIERVEVLPRPDERFLNGLLNGRRVPRQRSCKRRERHFVRAHELIENPVVHVSSLSSRKSPPDGIGSLGRWSARPPKPGDALSLGAAPTAACAAGRRWVRLDDRAARNRTLAAKRP